VLSADAYFQALTAFSAAFYAYPDDLADPLLVYRLERIVRKDALLQVIRKEPADIITREAESHLGHIVRSEREELRDCRELVRDYSRPRYLYHRPEHVLQ